MKFPPYFDLHGAKHTSLPNYLGLKVDILINFELMDLALNSILDICICMHFIITFITLQNSQNLMLIFLTDNKSA